eukprot:CAMPEP_0172779638 /NCGR_PEP_ID=MMETSP1074-20121228/202520_1 /TAXON_ID=2916 /ORGANISM="Ceratium fusus, Strain PA161109" /LENGTH=534 /DNA_ID=CAMNT_0013616603 /DNA_START=19 /DNA_END=1619 /DNA_ORIENTATION=-
MQTVFRSPVIFAFWIVSIIHVTHAEKCDNPSEGDGLAFSGLSSDDKVSETKEKHLLSKLAIRSDDTRYSLSGLYDAVDDGSAARPVELVFLVNVLRCNWPASAGCASEANKNASKNFVKAVVAGLPAPTPLPTLTPNPTPKPTSQPTPTPTFNPTPVPTIQARPVELVFLVNVLTCGSPRHAGCALEADKNASKNFVKAVVAGLPVGDAQTDARVAVEQLQGISHCHHEITLKEGTSQSEINKAVDGMGFYGGMQTMTMQAPNWKCIESAMEDSKTDSKKVLVVLSNQDAFCTFYDEAYKQKQLGLDILVVGVGSKEKWWLNKLGRQVRPGTPSFEDLTDMAEETIKMICEEANCKQFAVPAAADPTPDPTPEPTLEPTPEPTPEPTKPVLQDKEGTGRGEPSGQTLERCLGDSDSDSECEDGYVCFQRDGKTPVPGCLGEGTKNWDYCTEPVLQDKEGTGRGEPSGQTLGRCWGDCDSDSECEDGYVCFQRDGKTPVPGCLGEGTKNWDYCTEPVLQDKEGTGRGEPSGQTLG